MNRLAIHEAIQKANRLKREADLHGWLLVASLHEAIQKANQYLAEKEREMSDIGRIARVEVKRDTKRATAKDDHIRSLVRDELASLGGHLLNQADKPVLSSDPNPARRLSEQRTLAMLGGYLLEHYGDAAKPVAYRDPEPPAVGEPPTTTPGTDA